MLALVIKASTTTDTIEATIPFLDMRAHAIEVRDMAAAVIAEQGDQDVLELHNIGSVCILYSPAFGYAYVNEESTGVGNSLVIDNGEADSAEHAAAQWAFGKGKPEFYNIELAFDTFGGRDEALAFATWLNEKGHTASVGHSTGSYVDGRCTSTDEQACAILNALGEEYSGWTV